MVRVIASTPAGRRVPVPLRQGDREWWGEQNSDDDSTDFETVGGTGEDETSAEESAARPATEAAPSTREAGRREERASVSVDDARACLGELTMEHWEDGLLPSLTTTLPPAQATGERPTRKKVVFSNTLTFTARDIRRFQTHVVKSPSCWFWVGAISSPDGYGRFTWQRDRVQRTVLAHRFALVVSGQQVGEATVAEHDCNEPLCVRVGDGHLRVSTQSDNLRYAVSLGRHRGNALTVGATMPRVERSRRIRAALADGWDQERYLAAISGHSEGQMSLF